MDYQLVLQMRGQSTIDFDDLVSLEDEITLELHNIAEVDGHDVGCDETNIFIITSNPSAVFSQIKPILDRRNLLTATNAAFRLLADDVYSRIWPEESKIAFSVA